jgi:hypothetical protein
VWCFQFSGGRPRSGDGGIPFTQRLPGHALLLMIPPPVDPGQQGEMDAPEIALSTSESLQDPLDVGTAVLGVIRVPRLEVQQFTFRHVVRRRKA